MVEVLGALLGLLVAWVGWVALRALRRVWWAVHRRGRRALRPRALAGALRGARLGAARATCQAQDRRIAELRMELEATRRALRQARQGAPVPSDDRFQRAKRAFARHFHPDRNPGPAAQPRRQAFQEFWPELLRIERGKPTPSRASDSRPAWPGRPAC